MKPSLLAIASVFVAGISFFSTGVEAGQSSELADQIGKRVTVTGPWSNSGKAGPYVKSSAHHNAAIYIEINPKREQKAELRRKNALYKEFSQGEIVKITGLLHWTKQIAGPDDSYQGVPAHFYFYIDEADIRHQQEQPVHEG